MKLTFRKHEVKNLKQLEMLLAEHAEAIEPGCRIVAAGVNLGRCTVDLAGLDTRQTPILVALGFTADDQMLFRMLEAYAWALEYPESVRRVVGDGDGGWPPRVVFVAERVLEAFLRKLRLLKFPAVDCFEFRCVEVNDATGFYLDRVDWSRVAEAAPEVLAPAMPRATLPPEEPRAAEPPAARAPERPTHAEKRERREARHDRHERPEPVVATNGATGPNGSSERTEVPRWMELLTTPSELASIAPAPEPQATAAPREAPEAPADPGPAEPPKALDPKRREVLEGLELPSNRELTPTWRKFLERLTSGLDALTTSPAEDVAPAGEAGPGARPAAHGPAVFTPAARTPRKGGAPALLDGVQLPPNGELAPQWKRFLDKPAIDDAKIRIVKEYLHREFPLCTIYDFFEFRRNAQVFQLQDNQGKVAQIATISADAFEDRRDPELRPWLEKVKLAQAMRQAGQAGVFVSATGVEIERR